jgi:hypothetical protein
MTNESSQAAAQAHPTRPYPKGITRIDNERNHTHGWSATVNRASGKTHRIFSDGTSGGREAAYQLAVAWVEEHFEKFPLKSRTARNNTLRRNNRSGVPGVFRHPTDSSDRPGAYWSAHWVVTPHTRPKIRKFSIDRYGEEQAKQLAIQARTRAMQALEGIVPTAPEIQPKPLPRSKPSVEQPPPDLLQNLPKGITRIDNERNHTHGWSATVNRASGKTHRVFSDRINGGWEAAYQLAVAWVEEHFEKFPLKSRTARNNTLRRNNRSGVPGVFRHPTDSSDRPGAYWSAHWVVTPHAQPKRRKFSIDLYGEEQAKQLAVQARTRAMQALEGIVPAAPEIQPKPLPRSKPSVEQPPPDFLQNLPKGITRIDNERNHTHGWSATVNRASGKIHRVFSDRINGGWEAAYQLAVAWVKEHFEKFPLKSRTARNNTLRRNNRSGVPGVFRYPTDGSTRPGAYWSAQWVIVPHARPTVRKFSIAHYGESQAKWLAVQARIKAVAAMADVEFAERPSKRRSRKSK